MSNPTSYIATVSEKYHLTDNEKFLLVKLELDKPNRLVFKAGQYVSIKVNEKGERRSYSIASAPDVTHAITLVAELVPSGKGSEYLKNINIGDRVEVLAPLGRFVVEGNTEHVTRNTKLLFVATGSGIVPIKSMVEDLLINKGFDEAVRLHWGLRSEEDMFWFDDFERLSEEHPNFVFDQVLSKPSDDWSLCTGHVQDCITRDFGEAGLEGWEAYVCGHPDRVASVVESLEMLGMASENIYHEKFV